MIIVYKISDTNQKVGLDSLFLEHFFFFENAWSMNLRVESDFNSGSAKIVL